jgi:GNAT superfamily N-acetyltransferase
MAANLAPLTAPTADDLRAWHRLQCAALAHDLPGEPAPTQAAVSARLTASAAGCRQVLWLVRGAAGDALATATLRLFDDDGRGRLADVDMTVHPAHRRLGTGSRLLSTVTGAAADEGCRSVVTEVTAGTPGEGFLAARDFVPVLRLTWLRLPLDEVPERIGKLPGVAHPGYRLASWQGAVPADLAEDFARARQGMAALPGGRADAGAARWDAARVREAGRVVARRGERLLTVAALSEADGSVAGRTELVLPADGSARALQYDTAVLPAHRGHGLGLWMKAELVRQVRGLFPEITEILTDNTDDNRHMLAVNTAIGFRPLRRSVGYRLALPVRGRPAAR